MGAPKGNDNRHRGKPWAAAIARALARHGESLDGGLNKLADQLVASADKGDAWALKEVGDRMDGKAAQSLTVSGDEDKPLVTKIVREVVHIKDQNG